MSADHPDTLVQRELGTTGLKVTPLCFGTSALGNFPSQYGYEVDAARAASTLKAVFEGPVNFLDTSNNYGDGEAERRIGAAIARFGGLPANLVLATKVDPLPDSEDFSGARVRASARESLERLGLERVPLLYLHDPERISFAEATAPGGAVEALVALRAEGVAEHIGVAGGPIDVMREYLALGVFEAVISHNRYTLLDRSAEPLIGEAAARGVAFVNAAPYGGGMLVRGPEAVPRYAYQAADPALLARARAMERLCAEHDVPLAAAALQFSLRDPRVASTIVGISTPERVHETVRLAETPISDALMNALTEGSDATSDLFERKADR